MAGRHTAGAHAHGARLRAGLAQRTTSRWERERRQGRPAVGRPGRPATRPAALLMAHHTPQQSEGSAAAACSIAERSAAQPLQPAPTGESPPPHGSTALCRAPPPCRAPGPLVGWWAPARRVLRLAAVRPAAACRVLRMARPAAAAVEIEAAARVARTRGAPPEGTAVGWARLLGCSRCSSRRLPRRHCQHRWSLAAPRRLPRTSALPSGRLRSRSSRRLARTSAARRLRPRARRGLEARAPPTPRAVPNTAPLWAALAALVLVVAVARVRVRRALPWRAWRACRLQRMSRRACSDRAGAPASGRARAARARRDRRLA